MKVEIYSDVACPWCYIGKRRFERALDAFPQSAEVEVVYRPYQLDPGASTQAKPLLEHLAARFGPQASAMAGNVVQTARTEGIRMDFDRALSANTLTAHRLMRLAETEYGAEVQRAVAERLFQAYFSGGADVGDVSVLAEIGTKAGMDAERVRAYLASDEGTTEVRREIGDARRLGITAVPTFVFDGKYAVQGAQPPSAFLQALETVAAEAAPAASAASADDCADGACAI